MTTDSFRDGVVVKPYERLNQEQIQQIHEASLKILKEPGIWCYNKQAAKIFGDHGATVWEEIEHGLPVYRVSLPTGLVEEAIAKAPSKIVMGARDPNNRLILDSAEPRIYFGSGSETNVWIETELKKFVDPDDPDNVIQAPVYKELRGSSELLCQAANLCEHLDNLDFFIRPVNIQDEGVTEDNHDVNKFFASLNNITKHVQAGLTKLDRLQDVIHMAEIIAGGKAALIENPIISFIACIFKSPLQLVDDTAEKVMAIVQTGLPLVISSSPQGGSSAPIQEAGMVSQINAEILAGVAFTQLVQEGAPVLYGSVPVRARMDDLHDLYGCPEFNQYNIDCVQMARFYKLPSYSTSGVGDAKVPGMQSMFEKLFTHLYVGLSGAQYIHYAFGLLDRTNSFCPAQAVIDNELIGKVKHCLRQPRIDADEAEDAVKMVAKVMASSHRLFARQARKPIQRGEVSNPFVFESKDKTDRVIEHAIAKLAEIEARPHKHVSKEILDRIYDEVPGLLPNLRQAAES